MNHHISLLVHAINRLRFILLLFDRCLYHIIISNELRLNKRNFIRTNDKSRTECNDDNDEDLDAAITVELIETDEINKIPVPFFAATKKEFHQQINTLDSDRK